MVEQNHFTGLQVHRREIVGAGGLFHMQSRAGGHGRIAASGALRL